MKKLTAAAMVGHINMRSSMMRFYRFAVLSAAVLSLTGCFAGSYTGGGFTESPGDPDAKATFSINFHAIDSDGDGEVFDPDFGFDPAR